ncbi:MAG: hypothetical protein KC503_32715 [Myxococcales bacterium]|nr:hypothetical protein [Myxococcales bacterium]
MRSYLLRSAALASLLTLAACGARPAQSEHDSGRTDGLPSADSSTPQADVATSDSSTPADTSPAADTSKPTGFQQYLLWQSPGGFAGSGPALELQSNGTLRLWRSTPTMQPHQTGKWDYELKLSAAQTTEIFALLRATPYGGLPHPSPGQLECYPVFHYDPCVYQPCALSVVELRYSQPQDLSPQLDDVYKWLAKYVGGKYPDVRMPDQYCLFFP